MRQIIKIIFLLLFWDGIIYSQTLTKTDSIKWSKNVLLIEVPICCHVHSDLYEEGFFKSFFCQDDSAVITIHIGAMMNLPLIDQEKYDITSEFRLFDDVQVLRGSYEYIDKGFPRIKYFREENFLRQGITIMYENVPRSRLDFYDHVLNNIKVTKSD